MHEVYYTIKEMKKLLCDVIRDIYLYGIQILNIIKDITIKVHDIETARLFFISSVFSLTQRHWTVFLFLNAEY